VVFGTEFHQLFFLYNVGSCSGWHEIVKMGFNFALFVAENGNSHI